MKPTFGTLEWGKKDNAQNGFNFCATWRSLPPEK